ncbi:hypothetical protein [Streptomyces sp. NPDC101165]|uniref:hypothetical protein n=1 Tax=Streptomyces sp. NPDC101165 TaxID=3366119 RepID=UPI003815D940
MTTPRTTAQHHDPGTQRHRLADRLLAAGHIRTAAVVATLRRVPRHAFAPEVPVHSAYADDIIPTRHLPNARIGSSASSPWLQADILEGAHRRASTGGITWSSARRPPPYTASCGGIIPHGWGTNFPGAYDGQYRDVDGVLERWNANTSTWQTYRPPARHRRSHHRFHRGERLRPQQLASKWSARVRRWT